MLKIQPNSRQIPNTITVTADKRYDDLMYGTLQELSYLEVFNDKKFRYVDKKNVNFSKLGDKLGISRQIASARVKKLIELGLIEYEEKNKRYKLSYLDKSVSSLVPEDTLSKLVNTLNSNCISIFVYLLKRYIANNENTFQVTIKQMKEFIGISVGTTSNNRIITDILEVLQLLGLVCYEVRRIEQEKTVIFITQVNNVIKKC